MNPKTLAICTGLLIGLLTYAIPAQARPGWFVGGGLAQQSGSGDLDGKHAFTNSAGTTAIIAGELKPGTGFLIDGGYGFNKYVDFEIFSAVTSHKATSSVPGLGDTTATVGSALIGLRLTYPVMDDKLELFGRLGVSGHTVDYEDYALQGSTIGTTFVYTSKGKATFSGGGYGFGVGAEYQLEHVGFGLGYTQFQVKFDQAKGGGESGTLPSALNETLSLLDLTVLYHF